MKILIVANKNSNHAKKVADGLAQLGHVVVFVSPNDKVDCSVKLNSKIRLITLKYGGKKGYILNAVELRRLYKSIKPDVVNVHYASGCGLLASLASLHPIVLSCYGSDIFEFPHLSRLNNFVLRHILNNADALASTSYAMADEIRRLIDDSTREISITPFGVDVDRFNLLERRDNERPVIGIIKSLQPIYDIPLLINAFAIVCQQSIFNPILRIYGDGPLKEELQELTTNLNIESSVEFRGRIPNEEVPAALGKMDVFVNCSKQESFGVNILEAMACGVPVVATDCVGPKEIIEDGVSGIIIKDRKPASLADKIMVLLNNPELSKKISIAGRERVLKYYDWANNVNDLEKLLVNNCK